MRRDLPSEQPFERYHDSSERRSQRLAATCRIQLDSREKEKPLRYAQRLSPHPPTTSFYWTVPEMVVETFPFGPVTAIVNTTDVA